MSPKVGGVALAQEGDLSRPLQAHCCPPPARPHPPGFCEPDHYLMGPGSAGPLRGRKRDLWEGGHRQSCPAAAPAPPLPSLPPPPLLPPRHR